MKQTKEKLYDFPDLLNTKEPEIVELPLLSWGEVVDRLKTFEKEYNMPLKLLKQRFVTTKLSNCVRDRGALSLLESELKEVKNF